MIQILDYTQQHQPYFEKLNRDWIEKYFWMEPIDYDVLQHPDVHILNKGGHILMAQYNNEVVGTVALKHVQGSVYEFTKMAVDDKHQGLKIGLRLAEAAIEKAKSLNATSIILYSSTKLPPALALYRKVGFSEIPLDGPYKRSDIKMELVLTNGLRIRHASLSYKEVLAAVGIQTFRETFEHVNSAEDMKAYLDKSFNDAQLENELKEEGSVFLLAYEAEQPVGYARLRTSHNHENKEDEDTIEIERIYVLQSQLGKSTGRKLMETSVAYAKTKKCVSVWLGVWEKNQRAIRFYQKWGFEQFSSHVFMLGTDAQTDVLMRKYLDK
jgi:ribosomal protein S18 acetylase RimI-like enzyme